MTLLNSSALLSAFPYRQSISRFLTSKSPLGVNRIQGKATWMSPFFTDMLGWPGSKSDIS